MLYLIFDSSEIEKLSNNSFASVTGISYPYSNLVGPTEIPFIVAVAKRGKTVDSRSVQGAIFVYFSEVIATMHAVVCCSDRTPLS